MNKVVIFILLFTISVTAQYQNIQINNPESKNANEVTIAINPKNPSQMAAGANINYFYSSSDSGKTWTESLLSSSLGVWGDPSVIYDLNGNLYFGHLSNPATGHWVDRIVVQKSTDNGENWNDGAGIGYKPEPFVQDKEWFGIDYTNSSYKNNIYLAWTEFDNYGSYETTDSSRILFSRSTDGVTWSTPIRISEKGGNSVDDDLTVEGAVPAVGPNGEVYLSWAGPHGIMFDKSTDGGQTFGNDIFVTSIPGGWNFNVPGIQRCNGMPITACDISNSPNRGNIYINWSDQRNGEDNTDIFFIKSTDGGKNWGNIVKVNNDATTRHQFFSWMAVDPISGYIYIVFYDRRNTSGTETEVYLARSKDGGNSFENFKISNNTFDPTSKKFFGDYIDIDAYNGIIRPIWMAMDNKDMSVWTALIKDDELIVGVEKRKVINNFKLSQNYPNPFNPTTTIEYQIPGGQSNVASDFSPSNVELKVYDILGNEIETLVNEHKAPGIHEATFHGNNLPSGVYIYRLTVGNYTAQKKMILLK